jgi:outer membrane protein, heavy metal efflux system
MQARAATGLLGLVLAAAAAAGCATQQERTTERRLSTARERWRPERPAEPPVLDGTFAAYVAYAMHHSPELEASFERWRAATLRISRERRLPEPEIMYGYYIRGMETQMGTQRHMVRLRQAFPWPTRLAAGADAASLEAQAAEARFEAAATEVRERVALAYYRLWLVHRSHALLMEQEAVLAALADSVRGRVETGAAQLAELSQVHLRLERLRDHRAEHEQGMRSATAALLATIGAPPGGAAPVRAEPAGGIPAEDEARLAADASAHPRIGAYERMAEASEARARAAGAERLPGFALGLEWMEMGPARMAGTPGSGDDAVMVSVSVAVPLWGRSYRDSIDAARADGAAQAADAEAARLAARAELAQALADVRDAHRRILLYRDTLISEAESIHTSLAGSMGVGRAALAQVLLSEREVLELRLELAQAQAAHAVAWARLERVVGRPVEQGQ